MPFGQNAVRYEENAVPFAHKPPLFYLSHSGGTWDYNARAYAMIVILTFLLALLALLAPHLPLSRVQEVQEVQVVFCV